MIKLSRKHPHYCGMDTQYLSFVNKFDGWLSYTRRKNAARFKREELPEVISRLNLS